MSTIVRKLFACWRCRNATFQYQGRSFSKRTFGIVVVFVTIPPLFGTSVVKDRDKTGS